MTSPESVQLSPDERQQVRLAVLKAMAEENRLSILEALLDAQEMNVSQLCEAIGKEISGISHHLTCLKNCGLVSARRDGKYLYYSLNGEDRIATILQLLSDHADDVEQGALHCEIVHGEED